MFLHFCLFIFLFDCSFLLENPHCSDYKDSLELYHNLLDIYMLFFDVAADFATGFGFLATFVAVQTLDVINSRFLPPSRHTLVLFNMVEHTHLILVVGCNVVTSCSFVFSVALADLKGSVVVLVYCTGLGGRRYICFGLGNDNGVLFYTLGFRMIYFVGLGVLEPSHVVLPCGVRTCTNFPLYTCPPQIMYTSASIYLMHIVSDARLTFLHLCDLCHKSYI